MTSGTHAQFIYALSAPDRPGEPRYVGRTNDTATRLRFHSDWPLDCTVKDAWLVYLKSANIAPTLTVLEQNVSTDASEVEKWAKAREMHWIKTLFAGGADLVNSNVFWKHASRSSTPKGVRNAWCILHEIIARIDCSEPIPRSHSFHSITRFRAYRAIQSLRVEYPGLAIAPLDWIQTDPMDESYELDDGCSNSQA
jgi:hypothetical protein